jgi:chromosome segregation ATPase
LLRELQIKDEKVEDAERELEKIHEILEDHKTQLDVTERESQHLREQLATYERHLAEKENSISNLRTALTERTSGYPAMEQELAAKNKKVAELSAQADAALNAPAKVEKVEVPVEVLPAGYKTAKQAVMDAYEELEDVKGKTQALLNQQADIEAEINRQQAELNAGKAVHSSLEELTAAWEDVSGKMSSFQLAVLASTDPKQYTGALEALAAQLRKYVAEIEAALQR